MNKLLCGIDLPLSTIFQSVPGSLLHPGTQTDAEMTNKQTNIRGYRWRLLEEHFISFSGIKCDKENKFKLKINILSAQYDHSSWLVKI